jgi:hypothetical protein
MPVSATDFGSTDTLPAAGQLDAEQGPMRAIAAGRPGFRKFPLFGQHLAALHLQLVNARGRPAKRPSCANRIWNEHHERQGRHHLRAEWRAD